MGTRNAIAIDWGRRRLRAVLASVGRSGIKVRRVLTADVPADLNVQDAATFGAWVGGQLHGAGFPKGKAIIALGREHVALKRITLPTTEHAELADMTRLAMQRELPVAADGAVIDFVPSPSEAVSTTVLAVAISSQLIDHTRAVAHAAGLGIERITLRAMGVAALVRNLDPWSEGESARDLLLTPSERPAPQAAVADADSSSGLGVDVTGDGVEFCIVAEDQVRFSRAAEVPQPQDLLAIADAVVTEARRTWMSYRLAEPATRIDRAILMGDRRVSEYASAPVGEMLKIPVQVLAEHPRVDAAGQDVEAVWPLVGLLVESINSETTIDFANPRRAPDVGARARQRRLLAAGVALVAIVAAGTFMKRDRDRLEVELAGLRTQAGTELPAYAKYWRKSYKLEHLRSWEAVNVDWLKHATYLGTIAPPSDRVVLDSWLGSLEFSGVRYDGKTGNWSTDEKLRIVIDGEAKDRETADAFRETLVKHSIYLTSTTGGDTKGGKRMPFGFTYQLLTKQAPPAAPAPAAAANVSAGPAAVTVASALPEGTRP